MRKQDSAIEVLTLADFEVQIVRSKRKTLSLEITPLGVKARAPMRMRQAVIEQFVQQKRVWILQHLHNMPAPLETLALTDGVELLLEGLPIVLKIQTGKRGDAKIVRTELGQQLILPVTQSHLPLEKSVKNKLIRQYKRLATDKLNDRRAFFATQMNISKGQRTVLKVRDYKRRWGSCEANGQLSFNWRIIMAPPAVLDYVVIHELAHCKEFNHSARFWQIVEEHCLDWREHQAWLQHHGPSLYRF